VAEKLGVATRSQEDTLLASFPEIVEVDPWMKLCTETNCKAKVNADYLFLDFHHLNANGGEFFESDLLGAIDLAIKRQ
jgi:hypothetical protein